MQIKSWAVIWSYLLYTLIWDGGIMAAFLYFTIKLGHSMWFMLVALLLTGASYKPWHWYALLNGVNPKKEDATND